MNLEDHYEIHPAAKAFPMLPQDELIKLTKDICDNGLQVPIKRLDGAVLDGRNRLMACLRAGVTPTFEDVQVDDPYMWVWSLNGARRHLQSQEQKALIWKKLHGMSEDMQRERARIQAEANAKRAEAHWEKVDDTDECSSVATDCGNTGTQNSVQHKTAHLEAEAAGVNRGAIQRADTLLHKAPELADKVAAGEMRYSEAVREVKREGVKRRIAEAPHTPINGKFKVVYADPPWRYDHQLAGNRDIENHYPTMSIEDLCALSIPASDDALLLMWATAPKLEEAFKLVAAWGFQYKTHLIWNKEKIGMGYWFRGQHELLFVATRGQFSPPLTEHRISSIYTESRTRHSKKPEYFYSWIEKAFPGYSYVELFARNTRPGWSSWGNEI